MLEDRLLIWKFKHGSDDALRRMYEKYKNDLLALAVSLSNDAILSEDVVHDVFVSIAQMGARLELRGSLKSYLLTCISNRIRSLKGTAKRRENEHEKADIWRRDARRPDELAMSVEELRRIGAIELVDGFHHRLRHVLLHFLPGNLPGLLRPHRRRNLHEVGEWRVSADPAADPGGVKW